MNAFSNKLTETKVLNLKNSQKVKNICFKAYYFSFSKLLQKHIKSAKSIVFLQAVICFDKFVIFYFSLIRNNIFRVYSNEFQFIRLNSRKFVTKDSETLKTFYASLLVFAALY
jgi:hypothetical protein